MLNVELSELLEPHDGPPLAAGQALLEAVAAGKPPSYVRTLPPIDAVPHALTDFATSLPARGVTAALALLLDDVPLNAPTGGHEPYLSGPLEARYALRNPTIAAYLASLFHHVSLHCRVELCGWDLFHAHLFAYRRVGGDAAGGGDVDVGLLFHAREFPEEYTLSCQAIHPVGADAAGGGRDPRTGTRCSVGDASYAERNFLWTAASNRVHVLLPLAPTFPTAELLSAYAGYHFRTVSEGAFGARPLADINYLPGAPLEHTLGSRAARREIASSRSIHAGAESALLS